MNTYLDDDCANDDEPEPLDRAQMLRTEGPQPGERWRHHKGGEYRVVLRSVRETDLVQLISYESLDHGEVWTRTLEDFLTVWNAPHGPIRRFTRVSFNPENDAPSD